MGIIRVLTNGPGDPSSILGRVIPMTQKMVLDASLINTQHYKVWIKGKWSNHGKEVVPSPMPQCSSNCKGSLQVALNYGQPLISYLYMYFKMNRSTWGFIFKLLIFQYVFLAC